MGCGVWIVVPVGEKLGWPQCWAGGGVGELQRRKYVLMVRVERELGSGAWQRWHGCVACGLEVSALRSPLGALVRRVSSRQS